VLDKVKFLFTQWTKLPDSVNLREACDGDHVIPLSAASKCSFGIECTSEGIVRE